MDRQRKLDEALEILKTFDLPRQQQNDQSALTLLALLGLKAEDPWSKAGSPLVGITPIIDFIKDEYGKRLRRTRPSAGWSQTQKPDRKDQRLSFPSRH